MGLTGLFDLFEWHVLLSPPTRWYSLLRTILYKMPSMMLSTLDVPRGVAKLPSSVHSFVTVHVAAQDLFKLLQIPKALCVCVFKYDCPLLRQAPAKSVGRRHSKYFMTSTSAICIFLHLNAYCNTIKLVVSILCFGSIHRCANVCMDLKG